MKKIYENFEEIAEDFRTGENWTHFGREHNEDPCSAWQQGAMEFAKWLDTSGVKIIANPEIYEKLWENWRDISAKKKKKSKK